MIAKWAGGTEKGSTKANKERAKSNTDIKERETEVWGGGVGY